MDLALTAGLVLAAVALFGVLLQAVVYAYREGVKEQRLASVEEQVKNLPALAALMATLAADLGALKTQLTDAKVDLKTDIQEINHVIRNHLMARKPGG